MRRVDGIFFVLGFSLVAIGARGQDDPNLIAPTEALSPAEQKKQFHLPPGFEIELVVAEPEIGQPTNIAFDASGRLWINSTLEYPYPAGEKPRDALRYMDDTNGDGVPDKITTFAEGLNIPIGVARVQDAVLGYSIPSIYRFQDTDGDGKADVRAVAYSEFGFRDTHGMGSSFRPWLDGWVYACHGFNNDSDIQGSDHQPVKMNSGNTYRFRPDGSRIEQWTWGQVNPYGLAFDKWGNMFSSDCHTKPAYMLLRGAYYPSFGKPHDGLGFGPEMMEHLHGSTGIAGIVVYEAKGMPAEYRENLFIGNPVTGRINRDRLEWTGSSPRAVEMPDFLWCDDRWFRPVDLAIAPDGSLYVADFYNCIIGHYEVRLEHPRRDRHRGRIWRVSYKGTPEAPAEPVRKPEDLTKADPATLVERMGDDNISIRTWATRELVDRVGASAVPPTREMMATSTNPLQRAHGLWVIERLVGLSAEETDRLINDPDPLVRTHLVRAIGERAAWSSSATNENRMFRMMLRKPQHPMVLRAFAETLATREEYTDGLALIDVVRTVPAGDTHLLHALRIALRNQLRRYDNLVHIAGSNQAHWDRLADVAPGLATPAAGSFLLAHVARPKWDQNRRHEFFHHASRYIPPGDWDQLYEQGMKLTEKDEVARMDVLRALLNGSQERGRPLAEREREGAWQVAESLLSSPDAGRCRAGIDFARDLRLEKSVDLLTKIGRKDSPHAGERPAAVEALGQINPAVATKLLIEIVPDASEAMNVRKPAAELLGKLKDPAGTPVLVELFKVAPAELATFVARGLSWSDVGADVLLKSMEEGRAAAELLNDQVVAHELKFRSAPNKDERIQALKGTIPSPDEATSKLMAERKGTFEGSSPSAERGQQVFAKNCGICHQIAGVGAKIGPQLDGVGIRGLERLLEDTLDPDRNVDQAFRRTTYLKTDGGVVSGLFLRNEGAVLVLADAQGKEVRLAADEIDEKQESKLSPMPSDVARMLPAAEFADLMAYLLSQRQGK